MKQFNLKWRHDESQGSLHTYGQTKHTAAGKYIQRILKIVALRRPKDTDKHKDIPQPIDPQQHVVWLFDNIAYQPISRFREEKTTEEEQTWEAQIVACAFGREHRDTGQYIARIADFVGLDGKFGQDPVIRRRIMQRLRSLLYTVAPGRMLSVDMDLLDGRIQRFELGPSNSNGLIKQTVSMSSPVPDGTVITSHLLADKRTTTTTTTMQTRFAAPEGWLVISDIDDSIKVTSTSDTVGILRTTFVSDPEPIAGMSELYRRVEHALLKPTWVYLSASPYNLYGFLRRFLHAHYPPGMLMLRETSAWEDLGEFVRSYSMGTQTYKTQQMDKLHGWLPARKVVCIGDSTQGDPEAYAQVYWRYQGWVRAIYIRKVTHVPHMDKKNSDERFRMAFRGVPEGVWRVFEQPSELYECVDALGMG